MDEELKDKLEDLLNDVSCQGGFYEVVDFIDRYIRDNYSHERLQQIKALLVSEGLIDKDFLNNYSNIDILNFYAQLD